eukprot:214997-Chlamydomonas_euryale.AAC.2
MREAASRSSATSVLPSAKSYRRSAPVTRGRRSGVGRARLKRAATWGRGDRQGGKGGGAMKGGRPATRVEV